MRDDFSLRVEMIFRTFFHNFYMVMSTVAVNSVPRKDISSCVILVIVGGWCIFVDKNDLREARKP